MRALVFLHYRAGSSFFQHLVGLTPGFIRRSLGLDVKATAPIQCKMTTKNTEIIVQHTHCGDIVNLANTNKMLPHFCILTHIGDWWGALPSNQVPGPLESPSPMKWGLSELRPFFYEGWKMVNILRDGRSLIESTRSLKGGVEEQWNREDPEDYFKRLCLGFRNKARVALQCQQLLGKEHYRIFKFEDMMDQPLVFMNDLYQFLFHLDADDDTIREKLTQIRRKNTHSSFHDTTVKKMKQRYEGWTKEELRLYKEIAGSEHQELGYKFQD